MMRTSNATLKPLEYSFRLYCSPYLPAVQRIEEQSFLSTSHRIPLALYNLLLFRVYEMLDWLRQKASRSEGT